MTGRRRGRQLSPEEEQLWLTVAATVTPRRKRLRAVPLREEPPPAPKPEPVSPPPGSPPGSAPSRTLKPVGRPEPAITILNAPPLRKGHGLDGKREERFRKGELQIEARIDLHGLTLDLAHTALGGFLVQCRTRGARCVLVITGKGGPSRGDGALKRLVPRWLAEAPFAAMIASVAQAQARHGGAGALYVYLRRKKT